MSNPSLLELAIDNGLHAKLLLGLKCLQTCRRFIHICIDQSTDTAVDAVYETIGKLLLHLNTRLQRAKPACAADGFLQHMFETVNVVINTKRSGGEVDFIEVKAQGEGRIGPERGDEKRYRLGTIAWMYRLIESERYLVSIRFNVEAQAWRQIIDSRLKVGCTVDHSVRCTKRRVHHAPIDHLGGLRRIVDADVELDRCIQVHFKWLDEAHIRIEMHVVVVDY